MNDALFPPTVLLLERFEAWHQAEVFFTLYFFSGVLRAAVALGRRGRHRRRLPRHQPVGRLPAAAVPGLADSGLYAELQGLAGQQGEGRISDRSEAVSFRPTSSSFFYSFTSSSCTLISRDIIKEFACVE